MRVSPLTIVALLSIALVTCDDNRPSKPFRIMARHTPFADEQVGEYARSTLLDGDTALLAHSNMSQGSIQLDLYDISQPALQPIVTEHLHGLDSSTGPKKGISLSVGPKTVAISFTDANSRRLALAVRNRTDYRNHSWEYLTPPATIGGQTTSVAIASTGTLAFAYQRLNSDKVADGLMLAVLRNGSTRFEQPILIDAGPNTAEFMDIAWASDDLLYIAYHHGESHSLKLALYQATANRVHRIMLVDSTGDSGRYVRIKADSNHRLFLAYHDYINGTLRLAHSVQPAHETFPEKFQIETLDKGGVGMDPCLELVSGTTPLITYLDQSKLILKAVWSGSEGWTTAILDELGAGGFYSGILQIPRVRGTFLIHHHYFRRNIPDASKTPRTYSYEDLQLLRVEIEP